MGTSGKKLPLVGHGTLASVRPQSKLLLGEQETDREPPRIVVHKMHVRYLARGPSTTPAGVFSGFAGQRAYSQAAGIQHPHEPQWNRERTRNSRTPRVVIEWNVVSDRGWHEHGESAMPSMLVAPVLPISRV